jgi:hypothetical protein
LPQRTAAAAHHNRIHNSKKPEAAFRLAGAFTHRWANQMTSDLARLDQQLENVVSKLKTIDQWIDEVA